MLICSHCQHANREGMLFCEDCGRGLRGIASTPTIPTRVMSDGSSDSSSARATWGTAMFGRDTAIILHIRGTKEPVTLEAKRRLMFGRSDGEEAPDFDLMPYGAVSKGVSRQHAVIERSDDTLILVDMGSSNGTYLNGQRLVAQQPRVLRDGDEVRFGKLVTHIYFK